MLASLRATMSGHWHKDRMKIAPTETGCCIRVDGQGTMRHSPAVHDLAERTLVSNERATVVFDLSACDYLDSTFLGCLIDLYRRFGGGDPPRYFIAAPAERRKTLLGPTNLDRLIPSLDASPPVSGPWVNVPAVAEVKKSELMRHVMDCHRALAEVESPMRATFARIAEQIERELAKK